MKVSIWVLGFVIGGCAAHDHSSHEGGGSVQEASAAQQEMQHQPSAEAKLPPAPPAPGKKLPPPSKPKPAPEPQQQEESPPATDEAPDDAVTDAEEVPATDEEMFDGCGPMGEDECFTDQDCIQAAGGAKPWTDYSCFGGTCIESKISYSFPQQFAETADEVLRIWSRDNTGSWMQTDIKLPTSIPLEELCEPLKKSNYSTWYLDGNLKNHVMFNVVSKNIYGDTYGWYGMANRLAYLESETMYLQQDFTVIEVKVGTSNVPGPWAGYLTNLATQCAWYSLAPADYFAE